MFIIANTFQALQMPLQPIGLRGQFVPNTLPPPPRLASPCPSSPVALYSPRLTPELSKHAVCALFVCVPVGFIQNC